MADRVAARRRLDYCSGFDLCDEPEQYYAHDDAAQQRYASEYHHASRHQSQAMSSRNALSPPRRRHARLADTRPAIPTRAPGHTLSDYGKQRQCHDRNATATVPTPAGPRLRKRASPKSASLRQLRALQSDEDLRGAYEAGIEAYLNDGVVWRPQSSTSGSVSDSVSSRTADLVHFSGSESSSGDDDDGAIHLRGSAWGRCGSFDDYGDAEKDGYRREDAQGFAGEVDRAFGLSGYYGLAMALEQRVRF